MQDDFIRKTMLNDIGKKKVEYHIPALLKTGERGKEEGRREGNKQMSGEGHLQIVERV